MTKRNKGIIEAYRRSTDYGLYDVYSSFSSAKAKAWEYCKNLMAINNGRGLKVISANGFMFTAGFLFEENGVEYLMYITKTADTAIRLESEV